MRIKLIQTLSGWTAALRLRIPGKTSTRTKEALQLLSFAPSYATSTSIALALGIADEEVEPLLKLAVRCGLLTCTSASVTRTLGQRAPNGIVLEIELSAGMSSRYSLTDRGRQRVKSRDLLVDLCERSMLIDLCERLKSNPYICGDRKKSARGSGRTRRTRRVM